MEEAVALTLQAPLAQLGRILLPLQQPCDDGGEEEEVEEDELTAMPPPLPPRFARLMRALAAVRALASPALPFAACPLDGGELQVVALKQHLSALFKLLRAKQSSLGVVVSTDLQRHIQLKGVPAEEMRQACLAGLLASLQRRGWWQLNEQQLLGRSLLQPAAGGRAQACASLRLDVQLRPHGQLSLLVRPGGTRLTALACS